jgi:hypothetical protein
MYNVCIMWLVAVGFWYILYPKAKSVLLIVVSEKLICLLCSSCKVHSNLG